MLSDASILFIGMFVVGNLVSGQMQKSNATFGFRRLELRMSLKIKLANFVEKCYKNSTGRENYKLGVSEDLHKLIFWSHAKYKA